MIVCDNCGRGAPKGEDGYSWACSETGKDYCSTCIKTIRKPQRPAAKKKVAVRTCCPGILKRGRHDKRCRPGARTKSTGVTK